MTDAQGALQLYQNGLEARRAELQCRCIARSERPAVESDSHGSLERLSVRRTYAQGTVNSLFVLAASNILYRGH